jgi:hypothetical protein
MEKKTLENYVQKPQVILNYEKIDHRLLPVENEVSLDNKIKDLENFIKFNNGYGDTEEVKDSLYDQAKEKWQSYTKEFKDVAFTLHLDREQHEYLLSLLNNDLEYDVNTVFFAIELVNLLGEWNKTTKELPSGLSEYLVDATEITYIYHLISKHKVRGINKTTDLFTKVLLRIGEISKMVNYYDNQAKTLSKLIQEWVASFDDIPKESFSPTDYTPTF